MDTNEKNIVAIDLGSSKIALTVAKVMGNDAQIIYHRETPSSGIRYSSVFNVTHVAQPLSQIISQAEEDLGIKITQAVVGMPKFPVYQENSNATINDRGVDTDITNEDIAALKDFALSIYPLQDTSKEAIFGAVAQSFSDGENFQLIENDIIGMASDTLEGNFKIFIGQKNDLRKIDSVMCKCGIAAMRKYFTAESTAKAVLTDSEMENGVALVDFGGGCTSVSIYHGNIMRHYASIPFGGRNITQDIKSECQISESLAENIKKAFGACMPDKLQSLSDKIIHIKSNGIEPDKQLPVKYLSEIITARVEEIMMGILYEIEKSGFADKLRSGIVVTGGCAKIANLGNLIYDISGYKVRIGNSKKCFSCIDCEDVAKPSSAASMGLLISALNDRTVGCTVEASTNRILTEVVTETGREMTVEMNVEDNAEEVEVQQNEEVPEQQNEGVGEAGTEDNPQGTIWPESEVEKVEPIKKEKKKRGNSIIRVTFTKIKKTVTDGLLELYQDIAADDSNE